MDQIKYEIYCLIAIYALALIAAFVCANRKSKC
jgi:hypothetical protein